MTTPSGSEGEAPRLERLWSGSFGDSYVDRNRSSFDYRGSFWTPLMGEIPVRNVLEVGCNVGLNLKWISRFVGSGLYGIDINAKALAELRQGVGAASVVRGQARLLPFRSSAFDLVFTMGVLIHQPEQALDAVMTEVLRCSRRYVLCAEYYGDDRKEVPYRGETGALFRRNYGGLYQKLQPGLRLLKTGFLGQDMGWDDTTYWLFEKGSP